MSSPDEVFSVLGNETRMAILEVLWNADVADHPEDNILSFSELQDRVGIGDSGRFNYHLNQLIGQFIRKTDDGYQLRQAGVDLIQAILAGTLTEEPSLDRTPIDTPCPHCGGTVEVYYEDEELLIQCRQGTHSGPLQEPGTIINLPLPPAGLQDRTPDEIAEAGMRWFDAVVGPLLDDICPKCASRPLMDVAACTDHEPVDGLCESCGGRWAVFVSYECRHCSFWSTIPAYYHLWSAPAVIGWFHDRGIEFTGPSWESMTYTNGGSDAVVSTEPLVVEVTVPVTDETVTVTLNEHMDVVGLTESPSGSRTTGTSD
jgi:hypothetical protein